MKEALLIPALVFLLAAACRRGRGGSAGQESKPAVPDQVIGDFSMDNYDLGVRAWRLESPRAFVYEPEKKVELVRPHIRFYDKGRPGTVLEAGRGLLRTDRKDMRAWDGVVMVSTTGARLESPWMDYQAAEDRVVSTAPVTVTRGKSVMRGVGWEAKPDLSRLVVRHQTVEWVEEKRR
jgi:LPS export ABC transporter protein LptC